MDDSLRTLGRYRLRYRVASGGMASVYLAQLSTDAGFSKWVAIKTIHTHVAEDRKFVEMFLDEARLVAKLDHPHICSVFDFGQADGTYYIAMEYLHGESLERVARRMAKSSGVDPRIAARIVCDSARGLHHAHELRMDDGRLANVVHRDVSPQNLFVLYSGVSKVVDFGIARSAERAADSTRTGELKGKLAYMSPEQIGEPGRVDRRTDVWALGVVLWEITLGVRLFRRSNPAATVAAIGQPVPPPREIVASYPEALERIVMKALSKDLEQRYATAGELARDLERFISATGEPCSAEDVAAYISESFAEEKDSRVRMLASDVTLVSEVPAIVETPSETDLPFMDVSVVADVPVTPASPVPDAPVRETRSPWRWLAPILLAVGVAAGFVVALQTGLLQVASPSAVASFAAAPAEGRAPPMPAATDDRAGDSASDAGASAAQDSAPGEPVGDTPPAVSDAGAAPGREIETAPETAPAQTPPSRGRPGGRRRPEPRADEGADPSGSVPAAAFGTIVVSTTPAGLAVYRGSELLGRTPLTRRVPVGSYALRIVTSEGDSHRLPVVVEAYATSFVSLDVR